MSSLEPAVIGVGKPIPSQDDAKLIAYEERSPYHGVPAYTLHFKMGDGSLKSATLANIHGMGEILRETHEVTNSSEDEVLERFRADMDKVPIEKDI